MKLFNFFLFLLLSCSHNPIKKDYEAMRPNLLPSTFMDSLSKDSFFKSLSTHISSLKNSKLVTDPMIFGPKKVSKKVYFEALEILLAHQNDDQWIDYIKNSFDCYDVYGKEKWGEVLATGYYEPLMNGSRFPTEKYSQALYSTPKDLKTIDLKKFGTRFYNGEKAEVLQCRITDQMIIPYYTREEIDGDHKLERQKLELAWLDPIDAFFLHIQGSGLIQFSDGQKLHVGFDNKNGQPYVSIGKLIPSIDIKEMSMQKIKSYLNKLEKNEQQKLFNKNPSYVFFKILDGKAKTFSGVDVSNGRTIATDTHFFPKGGLAYLDIEEPQFAGEEGQDASFWVKRPRLVFDQDTGGAIKGPGRIDLYFGDDEMAAQQAGVMRRSAQLCYLVPR